MSCINRILNVYDNVSMNLIRKVNEVIKYNFPRSYIVEFYMVKFYF